MVPPKSLYTSPESNKISKKEIIPIANLNIKLLKKLGGEGQAKIYSCEIEGMKGKYATKIKEVPNVINNKELSN